MTKTETKKMAKKSPQKNTGAKTAKTISAPKNSGQAIDHIFSTIGQKSGVDKKRVDEWQTKWLAIPKNRTKYTGLKDAPLIMGEEIFAMANDIIDFVQHEEGGQSGVLKRMKEEGATFLHQSMGLIQKGKTSVQKSGGTGLIKGWIETAKATFRKAKSKGTPITATPEKPAIPKKEVSKKKTSAKKTSK